MSKVTKAAQMKAKAELASAVVASVAKASKKSASKKTTKKTATKKSSAAKTSKKSSAANTAALSGLKAGTKKHLLVSMASAEGGTTMEAMRKATGWAGCISTLGRTAASVGLTIKREKKEGVLRYFAVAK